MNVQNFLPTPSIANPPAKHATIPMITMRYGLGLSPMRIGQMLPILVEILNEGTLVKSPA